MVNQKIARLRKSPYREILIFILPLVALLLIIICAYTYKGGQQFSELALAFLHGHLNFLSPIGGLGQDPVLYHGKIYWGEGPFPALLLMPFVAFFQLFHLFFYQGYLQWILIIGVLYLVFKLARIISYSKEDSFILALGFTLGSVFIGVASASSSWFFAQVLTALLLFWSLYEFYAHKHKRWWLLGIICALIFMTRATAAPIFLFFCLELWQIHTKATQRFTKFIQLCMPLVVAVILLGVYNFLRFHSPFNGGYAYQLLYPASAESRSLGVFSLVHIPTNLYSALLRAPVPILRDSTSWTLKFPYIQNNIYGMSIFITSPYFMSLFTTKWSAIDSRVRNLLIATLVSCLLVLSFYGVGPLQFGYRYSLDFLPELFLVFMIMYRKSHRQLSRGMKLVLLGSGIVNFYFAWSFIFP
jgi:hypothetical protein